MTGSILPKYTELEKLLASCGTELVPTRNIIEELRYAKYEEDSYSGMGHGVGLDLHEEPFLGINGTRTMLPGCVITMEPGI